MGTYGSNPPQEGDVHLYQSDRDGDITVGGGVVEMTTNFDTMVYLALYGGNVEDTGGDDKSQQWWGNFSEPDTDKHYRSEYQSLIEGLGASSGNLLLVESAATRDLEKAFVGTGIASSVTVSASIPKRNSLLLEITIEAQGTRSEFKFTENWESAL